jgi:3,4-dihydroxy 2-butanone 4-phosphate synthase/GTP cyclohydrolase II
MDNIFDIAMDSIDDAVAAMAAGEMVIVLDDKGRENEGDLIVAADHATPEKLAFMIRHSTGILCVALESERADALGLDPMVQSGSDRHQTAFTVTVDAREGTTTGVSAPDRARTVSVLIDPATRPEDLMRPGHVFPLRARPGGVIERPGHTEAAMDLAKLAGCTPAGVIGEIIRDDGLMARTPELLRFARTHGLRIITIADLICYRCNGRDRRSSVHPKPLVADLEVGAAG